jgi:hypothetical protein
MKTTSGLSFEFAATSNQDIIKVDKKFLKRL